MSLSNTQLQRRRRAQFKAQGLVYVHGWVTPAQAEAIRTIMMNKAVIYQPNQPALAEQRDADPAPVTSAVEPLGIHKHKPLQLRPKPNQPEAWSVWLGEDELGTVYHHRVDEAEQSVAVWIAYRRGGHSSRHETRAHAVAALLQEYSSL